MAQWNQLDKTLQTKIVFWGPALCGKTTNLQQLHSITDPENDNQLISINTTSDRTLFFDLLPLEMGRILGHTLRIQLYTVPGQIRYDATRRVVLSGADAVVFVADSQRGRGTDNRSAWENLQANLKLNRLDPATMPIVVQYNKQDIPGCLHPREVEACLQSGQQGIVASALVGSGVLETFRAAVLAMLKRLTLLTGRRRVEDLQAIEEQVARAFARFAALNPAQLSQLPNGDPGCAPDPRPARPVTSLPSSEQGSGRTPSTQASYCESNLPGSVEQIHAVAGAQDSASVAPGARAGPQSASPSRSSSPLTIRHDEETGGEDLLVRSLRATLGIAEQFGEMREVKNRLARRVAELEGLQALARELSTRHEPETILSGLADAAISIHGVRAASVLVRAGAEAPAREAVVRGASHDPLIDGGGTGTPIEDLFRHGRAEILDGLPIPGGSARIVLGTVSHAMVVPLKPAAGPPGMVLAYSDGPFEADDLRFLGILVSHAAVCLDNAAMTLRLRSYNEQLEEDVRARTGELERANESLRELDRMKDRFLSSVSHEMRTPLTGILSGIELLSMLDSEIDGSREFLTMIEHEAKRLSNLVERILRFQVLGRSPSATGFGPLAPSDVIRQVAQEMSDKATARGIAIVVDMHGTLPALEGDAEGLALAIREIVDNAVRFSPEGETVQIVAQEKLLRGQAPDGEADGEGASQGDTPASEEEGRRFLVIAVRDCGPGIREEDRSRIFERFEQLGDLLTAKPDGLGLGLAIAREIVLRHGGELRVRSGGDRGSEFRLYLPVPARGGRREDLAGALEAMK